MHLEQSVRQGHQKRAGHSGRELLRILFDKHTTHKALTNDKVTTQLKELEEAGLAAVSVEAYNDYTAEYHSLNERKVQPKSDADLVTHFKQAVRDLSTLIENKLDMQILVAQTKLGKSSLDLDEFNEVVVALLGQCETDEERRRRREDRARANLAQQERRSDPLKGTDGANRRTIKTRTKSPKPRKPWTVDKGPCKHCGAGDASSPKQGHWHNNCLTLANKPDGSAKLAKKTGSQEGDLADARSIERFVGSFSGAGPQTVSLDRPNLRILHDLLVWCCWVFGPNLWVWYLVFQSVGMTFPICPDTYASREQWRQRQWRCMECELTRPPHQATRRRKSEGVQGYVCAGVVPKGRRSPDGFIYCPSAPVILNIWWPHSQITEPLSPPVSGC